MPGEPLWTPSLSIDLYSALGSWLDRCLAAGAAAALALALVGVVRTRTRRLAVGTAIVALAMLGISGWTAIGIALPAATVGALVLGRLKRRDAVVALGSSAALLTLGAAAAINLTLVWSSGAWFARPSFWLGVQLLQLGWSFAALGAGAAGLASARLVVRASG